MQDYTTEGAFRHAVFQTVSALTTAGFTTTDYSSWPMLAKALLMLLGAVGAMAGSTAGGLKLSRVILAFKGVE